MTTTKKKRNAANQAPKSSDSYCMGSVTILWLIEKYDLTEDEARAFLRANRTYVSEVIQNAAEEAIEFLAAHHGLEPVVDEDFIGL